MRRRRGRSSRGAASVGPGRISGGGERVVFDAWSTLICADWVPQDGYSAGVARSSNVVRDPYILRWGLPIARADHSLALPPPTRMIHP